MVFTKPRASLACTSQNLVLAWRIQATRMMRSESLVNIGMWLHQVMVLFAFEPSYPAKCGKTSKNPFVRAFHILHYFYPCIFDFINLKLVASFPLPFFVPASI